MILSHLFLRVAPLPPLCQPARAIRHGGMVLLWIDPLVQRFDAQAWIVDNLTEQEQNALREAYGVGPVGTPIPESLLAGRMDTLAVPPALCLPDEQAAQSTG